MSITRGMDTLIGNCQKETRDEFKVKEFEDFKKDDGSGFYTMITVETRDGILDPVVEEGVNVMIALHNTQGKIARIYGTRKAANEKSDYQVEAR